MALKAMSAACSVLLMSRGFQGNFVEIFDLLLNKFTIVCFR